MLKSISVLFFIIMLSGCRFYSENVDNGVRFNWDDADPDDKEGIKEETTKERMLKRQRQLERSFDR